MIACVQQYSTCVVYFLIHRADFELSLDYQTKVRRNTHGHRLPMTPSGEIFKINELQVFILFLMFVFSGIKGF